MTLPDGADLDGKVVMITGATSGLGKEASMALARLDFEDYNARTRYSPFRQYGRSKLANILFTRGWPAGWRDPV